MKPLQVGKNSLIFTLDPHLFYTAWVVEIFEWNPFCMVVPKMRNQVDLVNDISYLQHQSFLSFIEIPLQVENKGVCTAQMYSCILGWCYHKRRDLHASSVQPFSTTVRHEQKNQLTPWRKNIKSFVFYSQSN